MKQSLARVFNHIETKHTATLLLAVIITGFFIVESPEVYETETYPDYFEHIAPYLQHCQLDEIPTRNASAGFDLQPNYQPTRSPLKWWSLCLSDQVFGNERIIPFLYSIILIPVTYSFVTHLTQRKVAGLITVLVLVTSSTFTTFDTTATYEQSWVVFLMLSLIMIQRGSALGMILFFVLAIASKPITIIYVPAMFGFIIHAKDNSLTLISLTIITIGVVAFVLFASDGMIGGAYEFNFDELLHGFYNWWFYISDSMLVAMTLPLVLWRLFVMRKKLPETKPIMFAILIIIISVPLIDGFTTQLNHSYRFVPMIIFASTGIAMIVTNFVMPKSEIFNIRKNP